MASSKALRELSKQIPAPPEIEETIKDLLGKDDLHSAIIAVSILEATLEKLIILSLENNSKQLVDHLFQFSGPLSDFNSKILIAEAFGIINTPLAKTLHSMRNIRNTFAHTRIMISFDTKAVEEAINELQIIAGLRADLPTLNIKIVNNKGWFLLAIQLTLTQLALADDARRATEEVIRRALKRTSL
jgi:DNA-binding MltR family transcriptional regulator